ALVVGPPESGGPAHTAARLLADRLRRHTGCAVDVRTDPTGAVALPLPDGGEWDVAFLVASAAGTGDGPAAPGAVASLRERVGGLLPAPAALRPEGFALRTLRAPGCAPLTVVLGADGRGAVYGVGRLLREIVPGDGWCVLPSVHLEDAPAFPV